MPDKLQAACCRLIAGMLEEMSMYVNWHIYLNIYAQESACDAFKSGTCSYDQ